MIRNASLWWCLVACLSACADARIGETSAADSAELSCAKLREHVVELRLDGTGADRAQHRRALVAAMGASFLETCESSYGDDAVACALAANDQETAGACLSE